MTESPTRLTGGGRSREPALQRIGRSRVSNLTAFGQSLRDHAISELEWFVERFDHGFVDGGCRMFAQALVDWSGGNLKLRAVVRLGEAKIQHYVASDGRICLDADGVATDADMLRKMAVVERCPACSIRSDLHALSSVGIPYDETAVMRLVKGMARGFGAWPEPRLMALMGLDEGEKA